MTANGTNGAMLGRAQETESEEEPSWELSEDLREFTGDPGDRKAQLLFKQLQQVITRRAATVHRGPAAVTLHMTLLCAALS